MEDLRQGTKLMVSMSDFEFAKPFNYFVSIQLESSNEKQRSEVSDLKAKPKFANSTFYLTFPEKRMDFNTKLLIAAFVVTDWDGSEELKKGQARLLGETILELQPMAYSLGNPLGQGAHGSLKFMRTQENKEITVGRYNIFLKVVVTPR